MVDRSLVLLAILSLALTQCNGSKLEIPESKIIAGGTQVGTGEAPFQAIVIGKVNDALEEFVSSGIIYNRRNVIVPASALNPGRYREYNVIAGTLRLSYHMNDDNIEYDVERLIIHPQFSLASRKNDIAILKIDDNFREGVNLRPATLSMNPPGINEDCTVFGWQPSLQLPELYLSRANVRIVNQTVCTQKFPHLNIDDPQMRICANVVSASILCTDGNVGYGIPLRCNNGIAGLATFYNNCSAVAPELMFIDISKYRDWIALNSSARIRMDSLFYIFVIFTMIKSVL